MMIELPVTLNFDPSKVIGYIKLNEECTPAFISRCILSPAYTIKDGAAHLVSFGVVPRE